MIVNPILYKNPVVATTGEGVSTAAPQSTTKTIPSWNNLGRPEDAKEGTIGFNIQNRSLEIKTGIKWFKLYMRKL
jgi:hypothetical protein